MKNKYVTLEFVLKLCILQRSSDLFNHWNMYVRCVHIHIYAAKILKLNKLVTMVGS
jgi:hypothetical protein